MVYDNAGEMRGTGGGTRGLRHFHGSGGWSYPHPPYRSDADELLEAVVAAGFGGVKGAVHVHPGAMDAASDELPRRLALLPPAPDLGPVALPDLDAGAAQDVTDRAVLARVADAGVDPSPRVDADIRDRAADLHFGPMLHRFVLIVPESDALRHGSPPTVGGAVSSRRASGSLVSIP